MKSWFRRFHGKRMLYSQKGVMTGFVRKTDLKTIQRIVESSFAAETHGTLLGHGGRTIISEHCTVKSTLELGLSNQATRWNGINWTPLVLCTDCKSVYDCISKDGHTIGDRTNALNVAVLRQLLTTNREPSGEKAHLLWVPTRHQAADGLTKSGRHLGYAANAMWVTGDFSWIVGQAHAKIKERVAPVEITSFRRKAGGRFSGVAEWPFETDFWDSRHLCE